MPRGPRLDAPGILHHVMARGDRGAGALPGRSGQAEFVRWLADLAEVEALQVYAWAFPPNHVHLLVRTGRRTLPDAMRRLLAGYAGAFNRRHRRRGHLFQKRYTSIVVEADACLRELTRYLHLNPLRAGVVRGLNAFARYPWGGHSAVLGRVPRPWLRVSVHRGRAGRCCICGIGSLSPVLARH